MARYIDLAMTVDASRTRALLGWEPRPRLLVLRRLPFLLENRRIDPLEWNRANRAAMKEVHLETNLRIFALLKKHAAEIAAEFTRGADGPGGPRALPELPGQVSGEDHQLEPHADPAPPDELGAHARALDPGLVLPRPRRAPLPRRASPRARCATRCAS